MEDIRFSDQSVMGYWGFALFRLSNLIFASTWFVPDEYFQSVEVAYKWVFEAGHLTWEWHPSVALRSAIHPALYAGVFWVLKQTGLDFNWLVYWTPNILNALIFALGDVCYLSFLRKFFRLHKKAVMPTIALYITNWFLLYCATRSLANSLETALMLIALKWYTFGEIRRVHVNANISSTISHFPDAGGDCGPVGERSFDKAVPFGSPCRRRSSIRSSHIKELKECYGDINSCRIVVGLAALAVLIRPTAALIFGPLCVVQFWESPSKFSYIFKAALPCGLLVLGLGAYVDALFYGASTFPLFNFVRFNMIEGGSAEFGRHVWHWYVSDGLPSTLTLLCVPLVTYLIRASFNAIQGGQNSSNSWMIPSRFFWTGIFYVAVHSLIAHKEHRFLLPVLPLFMPSLLAEIESYPRIIKKYFKALTIVFSIVMAFYIGVVHQRGPNHAARIALRFAAEQQTLVNKPQPYTILQLTPCYSMPQYARFHRYNEFIRIQTLDCTPTSIRATIHKKTESCLVFKNIEDAIDDNEADDGLTESDCFHMDAMRWLRDNWDRKHLHDAQLIVAYEHTYRRVATFVESRGFTVVNNIYHASVIHSPGQDKRIVLAARQPTNANRDGDENEHSDTASI